MINDSALCNSAYAMICCRHLLPELMALVSVAKKICNYELHAVLYVHCQLKKHLSMFCSTTCDSFWRSSKIGSQTHLRRSLFFSLQEKYVLVFTRFFYRPKLFKVHPLVLPLDDLSISGQEFIDFLALLKAPGSRRGLFRSNQFCLGSLSAFSFFGSCILASIELGSYVRRGTSCPHFREDFNDIICFFI